MISLIVAGIFLLASCDSGYKQNIQGLESKIFCLDVNETKKRNNINIGRGTLTFNKNMTFNIENDTLKFSKIKGTWDLCCQASDWGNYVFKPENHIRQISSTPELEVNIGDKIYFLMFTNCE